MSAKWWGKGDGGRFRLNPLMGRIKDSVVDVFLIYFTLLAAEHGDFSFFDKLFVTCNFCLFEGIPKSKYCEKCLGEGVNILATSGSSYLMFLSN